jgi:hypothetical protein
MAAFTVSSNNKAEIRRHRIPYPPTKTYRTLPQKHTVPSDKCLSPPAVPGFHDASLIYKIPANRRISMLLGPRQRDTVPCYKAYRTLRQGIPYPPTRDTVPSDKGYRTLRQGIPYCAAKHAVPRNKSRAQCPCKIGKTRRRAFWASCMCFLLNVLMLFGDKD